MNLLVEVSKDACIDDEYKYVVYDDDICFEVTVNDDLRNIYLNDKKIIEEKIKKYCDVNNIDFTDSVVEKYNFNNITHLNVDVDDDLNLKELVEFINNNYDYFSHIHINIGENHYVQLDELTLLNKTDKLTFKLGTNTQKIDYVELRKTIEIINSMISSIEDLSALEKLMYIYDKVRDKVYCDDEDQNMSRDVSKVLLSDKIVCLGYAQVFNLAIRKVGLNGEIVYLESIKSETGHARNMVYVDDSKYNIKDAILFFDLTFDSKKSIDNNSFLESYRFFARPLSFFERFESKHYMNLTLPFFDHESRKEEIVRAKNIDDLKNNGFIKTISNCNVLRNSWFNKYSFLFNIYKPEGINYDYCINIYNEIENCLNKELPKEKFINCLLNVRKKQMEDNDERFRDDLESLSRTVYNTYKVNTKNRQEQLLLELLSLTFTFDEALELTKKVLEKRGKTKQKKKNC